LLPLFVPLAPLFVSPTGEPLFVALLPLFVPLAPFLLLEFSYEFDSEEDEPVWSVLEQRCA
jgi:hypothetical protein